MEACVPQGSLVIDAILFVITIMFCALFSFLETSITALRLFKLKELAQKSGARYRNFLATLENEPQRVLITTLIAHNIADVTAIALITALIEKTFLRMHWPTGVGFSVGIVIATIAILVFGEIVPKVIAKSAGERYLRTTIWLSNITFRLLDPVATVLRGMSDWLLLWLGKPEHEGGAEWVSEKEIQFLIEHISKKGLMEIEKTVMLQNIFELGKTPIKDIMVPGPDIVTVEVSTSINETLQLFAERHFTRLPVYEQSKENIIGIVHLKDLLMMISKKEDKKLREIVRPILFVPESLKVNQLLRELRQQHVHMAIVLNEHGMLTGLITLEDVLEEIVGEISDEHELVTEHYVALKQGGWLIDASMPLDEVATVIGIDFEAEEAITLGGFLTEKLQHLPKKGERILYKNYYFQVQEASPRRVLRIVVTKEAPGIQ